MQHCKAHEPPWRLYSTRAYTETHRAQSASKVSRFAPGGSRPKPVWSGAP